MRGNYKSPSELLLALRETGKSYWDLVGKPLTPNTGYNLNNPHAAEEKQYNEWYDSLKLSDEDNIKLQQLLSEYDKNVKSSTDDLPKYKKGKDKFRSFAAQMGPRIYKELHKQGIYSSNTYDNMMRQLAWESNYANSLNAINNHNYAGIRKSATKYAKYKNDDLFAQEYVSLIKRKYPNAVKAKNPVLYAKALKDNGYYEDSVEHYALSLAAMSSISNAVKAHMAANPSQYEVEVLLEDLKKQSELPAVSTRVAKPINREPINKEPFVNTPIPTKAPLVTRPEYLESNSLIKKSFELNMNNMLLGKDFLFKLPGFKSGKEGDLPSTYYAGTLPEVTTEAYAPIRLTTYYPVVSKYPYTGHSELKIPIDRATWYDYTGEKEFPERVLPYVTIDKKSRASDYNLVTNNCADATLNYLNKAFNTHESPMLFTTPGDVRDYAIHKLHGKLIHNNNGSDTVLIPRNARNKTKISKEALDLYSNSPKGTVRYGYNAHFKNGKDSGIKEYASNEDMHINPDGSITTRSGNTGSVILPDVNVYAQKDYNSAFDYSGANKVMGTIADFTPVVGDIKQGLEAANDLRKGNYKEAAIGAGLLLLPNVLEKPLKYAGKYLLGRLVKPIYKGVIEPGTRLFNSPLTGNWTKIGNREYRLSPNSLGINGSPIESRKIGDYSTGIDLNKMRSIFEDYEKGLTQYKGSKLPSRFEFNYEMPKIDFDNLIKDDFVEYLSQQTGRSIKRVPIKDTKHGDLYNEGFAFVDDEGKELAHIAGRRKGGKNVWVESSYVDPEFRYKGLGKQMYFDLNDHVFSNYGTTLHSDPMQRVGSTGVGMSPSNRLWKSLKDNGMSTIEGEGFHRYDVMAEPSKITTAYRTSTTPKITSENAASITPEQWTAAQDAAIAKGDMVEAQRLRDLHFKVSAPNTEVVDINGNPQLVVHKTPDTFTVFDNSRSIGKLNWFATPNAYGKNGVFATGAGKNPRTIKLYVNMRNAHKPTIDEGMEAAYINQGEDGLLGIVDKDMTNYFKSSRDAGKGFMMSGGVDSPNALKSANAVTYDDKGVRIPLGLRDNFKLNDIRYGILPFGVGLTGYGLLNNHKTSRGSARKGNTKK